MGRFKKPCRECGALSFNNLCPTHEVIAKNLHEIRRQAVKKATGQYSGTYAARAKQVRATAIICHLCGEGARLNDPWHADHLIPADPNSPLVAAHRSCNLKRGNKPIN